MFHDVGAAGVGAVDGISEDGNWQAVDFHVHLKGGNALFATGDFKVHVTGEIFGVHQVSQNIRLIAVHHQAHGNSGNWALKRHAGVHQS